MRGQGYFKSFQNNQ